MRMHRNSTTLLIATRDATCVCEFVHTGATGPGDVAIAHDIVCLSAGNRSAVDSVQQDKQAQLRETGNKQHRRCEPSPNLAHLVCNTRPRPTTAEFIDELAQGVVLCRG